MPECPKKRDNNVSSTTPAPETRNCSDDCKDVFLCLIFMAKFLVGRGGGGLLPSKKHVYIFTAYVPSNERTLYYGSSVATRESVRKILALVKFS